MLLKCFQFQSLLNHFPGQITNRAIHLYSNRFICFKIALLLCYHVGLLHLLYFFSPGFKI